MMSDAKVLKCSSKALRNGGEATGARWLKREIMSERQSSEDSVKAKRNVR